MSAPTPSGAEEVPMSQILQTIHAEGAPKAVGPYSQAVVHGDTVYCAGQIPLDPVTGDLIDGDATAQTERVLTNLSAVLAAAGASLQTVIKTTVFLTSLDDFAAMNAVYSTFFGDHRPARSTIQVSRLPRGANVEIEAIAAKARP
jgi:2-iminobutanoate/2-iminopropanoate deaminase